MNFVKLEKVEPSSDTEDGSYRCVYCGKTNCTVHIGLKPCWCDECCEEFASTGNLKTHFPVRKCDKPDHTDNSLVSFSEKSLSKVHIPLEQSYDERPYKCDACDAAFWRNWDLQRHRRIHMREHPFKEKPYRCDECGATFTQNGHLKEHTLIHTGDKPYKCGECGAGFVRNSVLRRHAQRHANQVQKVEKPKPHKCDECGAGFASRGHLKSHILIHTGEKPYQCEECGMPFARNCDLQRHMRTHIGGQPQVEKVAPKPHVCSECGSEFRCKAHLKSHSIIHFGERSFCCEVCGIAYSRNCDLQKHVRSHSEVVARDVLPKEKSYACEECGATFANSSYLKNHSFVHSGEKPFVCSECFASFSRNADLKRHLLVHRDIKPEKSTRPVPPIPLSSTPSVRDLLGIPKVVLYIQ